MNQIDKDIRALFNKLEIEYISLDPEPYMLEWMHVLGFKEKGLELVKKFNDLLKRLDVCCAVTPFGGHVLFWNKTLRDFGLEPSLKFEDFTSFIYDFIKTNSSIKFSEVKERIYLHYPCCLGRKIGRGDYANKIKYLLSMIPGIEIVETIHPEVVEGIASPWQWSPCALTGIKTLIPRLHEEALTAEVRDDIEKLRPTAIVSPCARSVWSFRDALRAKGLSEIKVEHTSSLILRALGGQNE
jgi:Fe-S oxidoreductase